MSRTLLYLSVLSGLFLFIGYLIGGESGMVGAFVFAALFNVGSYWFSDKLVLAMYQAKPLTQQEAPNIYSMVQELCVRDGLPMPRIYLIPETSPNAFATGRNEQHAVLGLTAGILDLMDRDELRGVIAHELSHIKNKDMLTSTIAATLAAAISMLGRLAFYFGGDERRGQLISFLIFFIALPIVAMLIQMAISREREYKADESGARLLGSGLPLAKGLRKLQSAVKAHPLEGTAMQQATAHLFIVNPFSAGFLSKIFSTHPPLQDRITRLEKGPVV
ncbi:MAG: zinc metalloprotease HtpX [Patescibacteria group bacterium]